ncbi:MAG: DUF4147 domain-containing protein [Alphaproteobacteria bacterium]|nr:MAG: DUF4147 domain-containing protein [Alphaproteobacteria bacterium]
MRAADPAAAVRRALGAADPARWQPGAGGRRLVVAIGKAAPAMAAAALEQLGPGPAIVVTAPDAPGRAALPAGVELLSGGHPLPDAGSLAAGARLLAAAGDLGPRDLMLVLVSGGASAMVEAPRPPLDLPALRALNRLLLESGFDITRTNLVRQALSRLKGGGLARVAAPARVETLILSDVIGDDPRAVASGPTVAAVGRPSEAEALLRARGLWPRLPEPVRAALAAAVAAEAAGEDPTMAPANAAPAEVIGSNALSLAAMAEAARRAGGRSVRCLAPPLTGDVAEAAARLCAALGEAEAAARAGRPQAVLAGGETTVVVRGPGRGGRNQELALRVALAAEGRRAVPWVLLAAGSDGRDGPTPHAGGLVDAGTAARIRAAGADPEALLAANDSARALELAGAAFDSGPTGTNVADLTVLLVGSAVLGRGECRSHELRHWRERTPALDDSRVMQETRRNA